MMNKTVLLIRNTVPKFYGGGETYQLMLARELQRHGFLPVIVSSSLKLIEEARKNGFKTEKAPYFLEQNFSGVRNLMLPRYWGQIRELEKYYRKLFSKYTPRVINVQSRDDWIAATRVAGGARVLWTDHMDMRSWVFTNVSRLLKNAIGKRVLCESTKAEKVIMVSEYEAKKVREMTWPREMKNMVVIKNGVEDKKDEFREVETQKNSFIYIGRLVDYKGIYELAEAFFEVYKKHPEARLNIYGDGEEKEKIQKLARGCKGIKFFGYTDEPLKAISENECFVLPSYREGLSLSLLDAAMMGKTIIATDVDGNPEVVKDGETGYLVPARNVEKLAEIMNFVLENPEKAKKVAAGARELYEKEFDFSKTFEEKMLPLYEI